jgi:hypothetical protein
MVKLLLKLGASIDTKNNQGHTPLEYVKQMTLSQSEQEVFSTPPQEEHSTFASQSTPFEATRSTFGRTPSGITFGPAPTVSSFEPSPSTFGAIPFSFGQAPTISNIPVYSRANLADLLCLLSPTNAERKWTDDTFANSAEQHWTE